MHRRLRSPPCARPPQHKLGRVIGEGPRLAAEIVAWFVAVAWCVRTRALLMRLGEIPDLSRVEWDLCPVDAPGLIVIVPAKDEAETLRPAMETMLAQDYPWLRIVAVDDRSTDNTGYLLEELAAASAGKLDVIHLTETPEGWLGKTFALEVALGSSRSEYVLFTEADVWLSPSILRRALTYAHITRADHLVVAPTAVTKTWGQRTLVSFLQLIALWAVRPWRVADPQARWDVAASRACSLVRRDALEELGGLTPQRLAMVDDLTLGLRMRAAGMRQRLAFAPGLVLAHGSPGLMGLIRALTRRLFAQANFSMLLLLPAIAGVALLFLAPLAALAWPPTTLPALVIMGCLTLCSRISSERNDLPARYGWLYPLGASLLLWAVLRSVLLTWWRRGVLWRGTLYSMSELGQGNSPFTWEWQATKVRSERRKAERLARPSRWLRAVHRGRQSIRRVYRSRAR